MLEPLKVDIQESNSTTTKHKRAERQGIVGILKLHTLQVSHKKARKQTLNASNLYMMCLL